MNSFFSSNYSILVNRIVTSQLSVRGRSAVMCSLTTSVLQVLHVTWADTEFYRNIPLYHISRCSGVTPVAVCSKIHIDIHIFSNFQVKFNFKIILSLEVYCDNIPYTPFGRNK